MSNPTAPPTEEIENWLGNMADTFEQFIKEVRPKQRVATNYLAPEILDREEFLRLLCRFPPAKQLDLSVSQVWDICQRSDIWRALRATLAYMIHLSMSYAPKKRGSKKRPGGADLWQAVYLGSVEFFVTSDDRMLESVADISALLPYPRRTMHTRDLLREFACR
jgi:hypothetical protein